jgi:hypothetical protein
VAAALALLLAARPAPPAHVRTAVRAKALLTGNEREFYGRLRRALGPQFEVVPQVAMGALMDVALPREHPQFWAIREQFSRKIVDYVVCERRTMRVIAAVELDDRTHDPERDRRRDALMAAAGIRTLRWDSRRKPSEVQIANAVASLVAR